MKKRKLRLCHLADIHLGYRRYSKLTKNGFNQREVDVQIAFKEAIDRLVLLKPDIIIIAGDLFHVVRPSNFVLYSAFREIKKLSQNTKAPIILCAGNHDSPKRADSGSPLRFFGEIPGVYVSDVRVDKFAFPELDLHVTSVPHLALMSPEALELRADDKFAYNVLVTHGQLQGSWSSDFGGKSFSLADLKPFEWDYIALGHQHTMTVVAPNAAYSGALEHTALNIWGERSLNKGFIELQLPDSKILFHGLHSPREVLLLDSIDATGFQAAQVMEVLENSISSVAGGIAGKIIKVSVLNLDRAVRSQLDFKQFKRWKAQALQLDLDLRLTPENERASSFIKNQGSIKRDLAQFCSGLTSPLVSSAEINEVLQDYLTRLEIQDEAANA